MSKKEKLKQMLEILLDFKGTKIKDYCEKRLEEGTSAYEVFQELTKGLDEIGRGYENKDFKRYFDSDLIVCGANMKKAVEFLRPQFKKDVKKKGKVLIGTVKGDVHDIGKSILSILLESGGFEIIDLGKDVDKNSFVEKFKETNPDILGMSALLSSTAPYMEEVVNALEKEGLRKKIKIIVGGRAVTQEYADKIGADAYAKDAIEGVEKCLLLMGARTG